MDRDGFGKVRERDGGVLWDLGESGRGVEAGRCEGVPAGSFADLPASRRRFDPHRKRP